MTMPIQWLRILSISKILENEQFYSGTPLGGGYVCVRSVSLSRAQPHLSYLVVFLKFACWCENGRGRALVLMDGRLFSFQLTSFGPCLHPQTRRGRSLTLKRTSPPQRPPGHTCRCARLPPPQINIINVICVTYVWFSISIVIYCIYVFVYSPTCVYAHIQVSKHNVYCTTVWQALEQN